MIVISIFNESKHTRDRLLTHNLRYSLTSFFNLILARADGNFLMRSQFSFTCAVTCKSLRNKSKTTLINTKLSCSIINSGGDGEPSDILIKNVPQNNFHVNVSYENDSGEGYVPVYTVK